MKPYFAKYLPIEGEIKEGNIAWSKEDGFFQAHGISLGLVDGAKAVKLFLCSRDIQVGDNYQISDISGNISIYSCIKRDNDRIYYGEITSDDIKQCWKVIGEISKEATWVKEGDEFEKEQVSFLWDAGEENKGWFRIKGPCGHFH